MPEGPEVKRIVDQLNRELKGKKIVGMEIVSGRYMYHGPPEGIREFTLFPQSPRMIPGPDREFQGHIINSVKCKGKFIYFELDSGWSIWNTLGMTGGWSRKLTPHSRVSFIMDDGTKIYFNDMRNFGTIKFVYGVLNLWDKLDSLGPDMLTYDMPDHEFRSIMKKHPNKSLAQILMDQKVISGVGNYIKCESLYLAKLSPHRLCNSLSDNELDKLNKAIKSIIRDSYESGGSTFRTYQDLNGEVGSFSERFMIYGKKADPAGRKVIKEATKDKRTTHWVPSVQV